MTDMNILRSELTTLYSELDLGNLLNTIAEKIKTYLNCEESSIFLFNPRKEELYFEIATGNKEEELKKIILKKGEGIAGWIAERKECVVINNCAEDPRFEKTVDKKTSFVTNSILGVPVISGDTLIGVVEAINKIDEDFSDDDEVLLKEFSSFISIPLQNAILFRDVMSESKEKGQLIELGKIVSSSFSFEDVFNTLKDIITGIIPATGINVMVDSQKKIYKLIEQEKNDTEEEQNLTIIKSDQALFPLRTKDKHLGFLEISSEKPIHETFLSLLRGLSIFVAISINKYEMYQDLLEKERIEKELQIARDIQQSFLMSEKIDLKGIDFSFINVPSSSVGGDYYDIIKLSENNSVFTIDDISGHGIPASLLMSIVRANFVYTIRKEKDILKTIRYLNDLIAETTEPNLYVTSFTCSIDTEKKLMQYLNCGHNPSIIIRNGKAIELTEGDTVLGMFSGSEFNIREESLENADIIILYTDGVIEAENNDEEQFSIERLKNVVIKNSDKDPDSIKKEIMGELTEFTGSDHFTDDITFVIIRIS
ncbi:MAG: SpoIIE family protein phosphatase [Candidatus Aminicenantes bacterium]|nr:SpoIIE family protein phosphatase [Candidatus Aminicenantes bacterium]